MGGAFGSGFSQGFNQSMQQAQDRAIQDEYKKVLMSKAKNDIEMHMIDQQDMQAASQGDQNALMRLLIRKDPMMAFAMSGQQGGQQQQPEVNIGMNYEEPTGPQTKVTFPAQLTGTPQLQIDPQRILHKKIYGWDPAEAGPNIPNAIDPATQQRATGLTTKAGGIRGYVPTMPQREWAKTSIPGVEMLYEDGRPTGTVRQGQQEYEIKMKKMADGSEVPVYMPKQPNGGSGANPQQALPGQIQMVIDPNKPGAIDEAITGLQQVKKKGIAPTFGGSPGALSPPARGMYLKNEDLKKYIDPATGERPKGNWTEDMLDSSNFMKEPDKKLTTEESAKLSGGIESVKNLPMVRERLFPNGQLDADFAKSLWLWYKSPEAMANSEVAAYGKILKDAGESQIRMESGAAVPPEEIKRLTERYVTQLFSSPESVATGFDLLFNRMNNTVSMMDPSGFYRKMAASGRQDIKPQKPSLLPKGNGKTIDKGTAQKFLNANGNDPVKAREAAKAAGWKVQ